MPVGEPSRQIAPSIWYQVHPDGGAGFTGEPVAGSGAPIGGDRSTKPGLRLALPTGSPPPAPPPPVPAPPEPPAPPERPDAPPVSPAPALDVAPPLARSLPFESGSGSPFAQAIAPRTPRRIHAVGYPRVSRVRLTVLDALAVNESMPTRTTERA